MGFLILLILSTLCIAGSAAFFSVIGLARIFSGAFWSVVFMGSSLEAGKLVAASYLYRFWKDTSKWMRAYLLVAIMILMSITSMGIFGYLSSAFQGNVLPLQQQQQQIQLLESDKAEAEKLKAERLAREQQINQQIANLPPDYVNGRRRLIAANKDELTQIRTDVAQYTTQIRTDTGRIAELKSQVLQETAHVGPIIFIAEVFGADVNHSTKWLIILLTLVFDPLAVILTIGINLAILKYKASRPTKTPKPEPVMLVDEPAPVIYVDEAPPPIDPVIEEDLITTQPSQADEIPTSFPETAFSKAHQLFSNPNLTEHEKSVARSLEETINRYMQVLGK